MKRIALAITAFLTLALAGCASTNEQYYAAMKEIEIAKANTTSAQAAAMLKMAVDGDAQAKGMYMMWLATKGAPSAGGASFGPPQDPALMWASILVPGATNLASGYFGYKLGQANTAASVQMHSTTMGTLGGIATTGIQEAGKVVFPPVYVVPMGSAPAETSAPVATQ